MSKPTSEHLFERTSRLTDKNHMVVVAEPTPNEPDAFSIDVSVAMDIPEVMAAADSLLQIIIERTSEASKACASCEDRRERAQNALAALRNGRLGPFPSQPPQKEPLH